MKVELELNDEVAEEILTWAKENFGDCSMPNMSRVIEELVTNALIMYRSNPDDYSVTEPPDSYWRLFSPES